MAIAVRGGACLALLLFSALEAGATSAQTYPAKPIRLIVPFAAGGSTDIIARVVGQKMGEGFGQQIIIDNRPGAASSLGTELGARAAPDGYTLLMGTPGLTINPSLYAGVKFHPVRDFSPVILMASVPLMIVVHPSLPVRSVEQLVRLAKSRPGDLNYASAGSSTHLTAELFMQRAGISMVHVPYKGSAPATNDLVAGHVQVAVDNILSALPHVEAGKLRALAVTSAKRALSAPQTPTLAELGFPGFDASSWFGLLAPAGVSKDIVSQLNASAQKALQSNDVREKLVNIGAAVVGSTPEQFGTFIAGEHERWAKLIKERKIKTN
ncbi:MAG: tripartite tricarboxylate transporter substrate binding protein [Betaproteobacteria bacterium]|nr:tripartite tricarboxylate transporter substrate binding protein [Betaproteobacteria bacterium]